MSTQSLPKLLLNGGGLSNNHVINMKFSTLSRIGDNHNEEIPTRPNRSYYVKGQSLRASVDQNNNKKNAVIGNGDLREFESARKNCVMPQPPRRRGSFVNKFRGVKREELDKKANVLIYSMTVGIQMGNFFR